MFGTLTLTLPSMATNTNALLHSSSPRIRFSDLRCKASVCAFTESATVAGVESRRRPASSLYEVLRVKRTASLTEIKTAYRSLAKMYHPDAMTMQEAESDGLDFIEIHSAYATLSDPTAKAMYDLSLGMGGAHYQKSPFAFTGRNQSGFYPTRRWETDQCW